MKQKSLQKEKFFLNKLTPLLLMFQKFLLYLAKFSSVAYVRKRYWVEDESMTENNYETLDHS
ncbi:MAG: hypothetical protein BRC50_04940 [Cyanobacteria bacterium SW_11_48_12]|nr:MAG: hypothetical protein BRC50_04940 [Cyanobacteria bacterium SW_11_48_12]